MTNEERLEQYKQRRDALREYEFGKSYGELKDDPKYRDLKADFYNSLRGYIEFFADLPLIQNPEDEAAAQTSLKLFNLYCEEYMNGRALVDFPEDAVAEGAFPTKEAASEAGKQGLEYAEGILSVARELQYCGTCGWEKL